MDTNRILILILLLAPLSVSAQAELPRNDRMVMQSVSGISTGIISAATLGHVFALGAYGLMTMGDNPDNKSLAQSFGEMYGSYAIGVSLAYAIGSSYAITYTGNNNNPIQGRWLHTFVGTGAGMFLGVVGASAIIDGGSANPYLVVSLLVGSTTAGSLVGYNQSRVLVRLIPDPTRAVTLRIPL